MQFITKCWLPLVVYFSVYLLLGFVSACFTVIVLLLYLVYDEFRVLRKECYNQVLFNSPTNLRSRRKAVSRAFDFGLVKTRYDDF